MKPTPANLPTPVFGFQNQGSPLQTGGTGTTTTPVINNLPTTNTPGSTSTEPVTQGPISTEGQISFLTTASPNTPHILQGSLNYQSSQAEYQTVQGITGHARILKTFQGSRLQLHALYFPNSQSNPNAQPRVFTLDPSEGDRPLMVESPFSSPNFVHLFDFTLPEETGLNSVAAMQDHYLLHISIFGVDSNTYRNWAATLTTSGYLAFVVETVN